MKIRKALVAAAGFGTRFLPISKTLQKEMNPILGRPLIDHTIADCVAAGIEEIIFVVSEHNNQLKHFYSENKRLERYLEEKNKSELYEKVAHLHSQARFSFIQQPDSEQYGTASPLNVAQHVLQDEDAFLVIMGDDFIFNTDGSSETARMLETMRRVGGAGLMSCVRVPREQVDRYGVVATTEIDGHTCLDHIVEKPTVDAAPSNLVNISKYIFTPHVFEILAQQKPNPDSGELYITDTATELTKHGSVAIFEPQGVYLDGGDPTKWLKANLTVGWNDPHIRAMITETVAKLTSQSQ